jgi:hydroxymethylpyrimidine pyrophosphatase-like HAD family hydrolase
MTRAVVVDFDGTLRRSDGKFNEDDLEALRRAGRIGAVRVIATGRSLFSLRREVETGTLPVDYVVFSSGAGVIREPGDELIRSTRLGRADVLRSVEALRALGLAFMVHDPIPDNHRFAYDDPGDAPEDFHRRMGHYKGYALELPALSRLGPAAQLLAVVEEQDGDAQVAAVRAALPDLSVIRATSPLDHRSVWIEVFAAGVSKSDTTSWVLSKHGITPADVLAIGNDYNDTDLLDWAGSAFVTDNAPDDLKRRFEVVRCNDTGGVAQAMDAWIQ